MSMPAVYYRFLTAIPVDVPQPDKGGKAPAELATMVKTALNLIAWAGTAAGVVGVLVCGAAMAIEHRKGTGGSEHMSRLGVVLGGCILVAVAGPVVSWFFGAGGGDDGGTGSGGAGGNG
jgi:hypothetical protein